MNWVDTNPVCHKWSHVALQEEPCDICILPYSLSSWVLESLSTYLKI